MEAAVTFVGFAASLVTLIAVVGDSAQTVHTLWTNFRDSSTNLKRLSHAIAENEALLKDMHYQLYLCAIKNFFNSHLLDTNKLDLLNYIYL